MPHHLPWAIGWSLALAVLLSTSLPGALAAPAGQAATPSLAAAPTIGTAAMATRTGATTTPSTLPTPAPTGAPTALPSVLPVPWCTPGDGSVLVPGQSVTCFFDGGPLVALRNWSATGLTLVNTTINTATFVAGPPQMGGLVATWAQGSAAQVTRFGYTITQSTVACDPNGLVMPGSTVSCSFVGAPSAAFLGWTAPSLKPATDPGPLMTFTARDLGDSQITASWQEGTQYLQTSFSIQVTQGQPGCSVQDGATVGADVMPVCSFTAPSASPQGILFLQWTTSGWNPQSSNQAQSSFMQQAPGTTSITANWYEGRTDRSWTIHLRSVAALVPTPTPTLAPTGQPLTQCPLAGIVNWWPGRDGTDRIGGSTASLINGATLTTVQGRPAFQFDGRSGYASQPLPDTVTGNDSITIATWFNTTRRLGTVQTLVAAEPRGGIVGGDGVYLQEVGDTIQLLVETPVSAPLVAATVPAPAYGTWHHVVATYDAGTGDFRLFLDGILAAVPPNPPGVLPGQGVSWGDGTTGSPTPAQLYFGAMNDGVAIGSGSQANTQFYAGALSDIEIYGRALTASEAQQLFLGTNLGRC